MRIISPIFNLFRSLPAIALKGLGILLLIIVFLYYPIGMILISTIDDDVDFRASTKFEIAGGSHSVAIAEALLDREINKHGWQPNAPFFMPAAGLVRMPAFQRGIMKSLARFGIELSDQIGRARGSSSADPDLQKAAGLLNYPTDVWLFDIKTTWLPTASSQTQYLGALQLMQQYNTRLASGTGMANVSPPVSIAQESVNKVAAVAPSTNQAIFDKRADNLMNMLERMATDLGSSSAAIDNHIRDYRGRWIDTGAADNFFTIKGMMYADYLLLRELRNDFSDVIKEKQLDTTWDNMLRSFKEGAELRHFFVFNADVSDQFLPNHLAVQGFYLMRARTQMLEVTNILLK